MSKRRAALLGAVTLDAAEEPATMVLEGSEQKRLRRTDIVPNPDQPRRHFDEEAMAELVADMRARGQLQPVRVREIADGPARYMLIVGERRWRAAALAGLDHLDAVIDHGIHDPEEAFDAALAENIQRDDLTREEQAAALRRYRDGRGMTQEAIAARIHKSLAWVTQVLAYADLGEEGRAAMDRHSLPLALAKSLRPYPAHAQAPAAEAVAALPRREEQAAVLLTARQLASASAADITEVVRHQVEARLAGTGNGHGGSGVTGEGPGDQRAGGAVPAPARPPRPLGRPTRITLPFTWDRVRGAEVDVLYANPAGLAVTQLLGHRQQPATAWVQALLEDVRSFRDACARQDRGAEEWSALSEGLAPLLGPG